MRTIGSAIRSRRTRSPTACTVCPRISKPIPTLATVAGAKAVTVCTSVPWLLYMRTEIGGQTQQIGEHASGGDFRTRPRALHDQWIVAIAARRIAHHVVGERD